MEKIKVFFFFSPSFKKMLQSKADTTQSKREDFRWKSCKFISNSVIFNHVKIIRSKQINSTQLFSIVYSINFLKLRNYNKREYERTSICDCFDGEEDYYLHKFEFGYRLLGWYLFHISFLMLMNEPINFHQTKCKQTFFRGENSEHFFHQIR